MDERVESRGDLVELRGVGSERNPTGSTEGERRQEEQRKFQPDIYWYLSFRCNLACVHCSVFSSPFVDTSSDLSTEEALAVVDQMAELNVRNALLSGGEVLLRPDALDIMRALAERGIGIGLETNGLMFSEAFAELAVDLQRRGRLSMTISVDGGTEATHEAVRGRNTFAPTIRGLHFLRERGVRFNIQCILNRSNYLTIPDLYAIARELRPQLGGVLFGVLNPVGRGDELVEDLGLRYSDLNVVFELVRHERATFDGHSMIKVPPAAVPPRFLGMVFKTQGVSSCVSCQFPLLGVLPNGDVTVCALSRDDGDLHFGNVRNDRLGEIWERTRMDMLRSRYVAAEHLEGICADCVYKKSCRGGCRAWAYEEEKSFDAPLPLCQSLADGGEFPDAYRISKQRAGFGSQLPPAGICCS